MLMNVKIKYWDGVAPLEKTEKGDWIDLRARVDVTLEAGDYAVIPLGIAMELPEGCEAHIVPRSSTFRKWGLLQTNGMGIVDSSYCGNEDEWGMPVMATQNVTVKAGERVCQFRIVESMPAVRFTPVEKMERETRGGFGSTGTV